jgi:hypothetical protein
MGKGMKARVLFCDCLRIVLLLMLLWFVCCRKTGGGGERVGRLLFCTAQHLTVVLILQNTTRKSGETNVLDMKRC